MISAGSIGWGTPACFGSSLAWVGCLRGPGVGRWDGRGRAAGPSYVVALILVPPSLETGSRNQSLAKMRDAEGGKAVAADARSGVGNRQ